jgi:hypothetical protein
MTAEGTVGAPTCLKRFYQFSFFLRGFVSQFNHCDIRFPCRLSGERAE